MGGLGKDRHDEGKWWICVGDEQITERAARFRGRNRLAFVRGAAFRRRRRAATAPDRTDSRRSLWRVALSVDCGLSRAKSRHEGAGRRQQIEGYQRPDNNDSPPA